MAEAMDLCVACKGCKRECEANVDMALIKAEYLAQHAAHSGLSLRGRLFAHLPRWLHRSPWLKGLIRWRNDSPLLARLGQRLLGIAADRPLPEPAPWPFGPEVSAARNHQTPAGDGLPEVVLFVDTFSRHFEPGIARAAVAVLRAGGYRVLIAEPLATDAEPARPLCCGRTYLAQGMVDAAREEVERLVDALLPHVEAGRVIVGLEASCALGLRDDARALGLNRGLNGGLSRGGGRGDALERIACNVLLFEEFLAKELMAKRLTLPLRASDGLATLVHGHCHQKAVGATKAMRRVLKLIPGHDFSVIDAGCCGMAGTFRLEAEHAAMASAMAQLLSAALAD